MPPPGSGADPAGIQLADAAGLGGAVPAAVFFFALNYYSVKTFARSNNFISVLKFLVPLLV
jgi:amino acid transporter